MSRLTSQRTRLIMGIVAALVALFFVGRFLLFVFFPPPPFDGRIEGWMTPRFVSHVLAIPPDDLAPILGLKPGGGKRETLDDIAKRLGITTDELIARIEAIRPPKPPEPPGQ